VRKFSSWRIQRVALLIGLIHQHKGTLSKEKRDSYFELSEEEIGKIAAAIKAAAERLQHAESVAS
jgi:hypothetical protein